jgi:hypothetical protein
VALVREAERGKPYVVVCRRATLRIRFYSAEMNARARETLKLENALSERARA